MGDSELFVLLPEDHNIFQTDSNSTNQISTTGHFQSVEHLF